jgi:hypothetical protein
MQILKLSGQATIADVAAAAYGLKATDPALAAAEKNLIAANPSLGGNVAALPKNTVVAVPPLNGVPAVGPGATTVDPIGSAFRARLQNLSAAVTAAAAPRSAPTAATALLGSAPGATTTAPAPAQLDFSVLQSDLAAFIKLHSS